MARLHNAHSTPGQVCDPAFGEMLPNFPIGKSDNISTFSRLTSHFTFLFSTVGTVASVQYDCSRSASSRTQN